MATHNLTETVMVRDGNQQRAVKVEIELDLAAMAQQAMNTVSKKCEALDGAVRFRVKTFKR